MQEKTELKRQLDSLNIEKQFNELLKATDECIIQYPDFYYAYLKRAEAKNAALYHSTRGLGLGPYEIQDKYVSQIDAILADLAMAVKDCDNEMAMRCGVMRVAALFGLFDEFIAETVKIIVTLDAQTEEEIECKASCVEIMNELPY